MLGTTASSPACPASSPNSQIWQFQDARVVLLCYCSAVPGQDERCDDAGWRDNRSKATNPGCAVLLLRKVSVQPISCAPSLELHDGK